MRPAKKTLSLLTGSNLQQGYMFNSWHKCDCRPRDVCTNNGFFLLFWWWIISGMNKLVFLTMFQKYTALLYVPWGILTIQWVWYSSTKRKWNEASAKCFRSRGCIKLVSIEASVAYSRLSCSVWFFHWGGWLGAMFSLLQELEQAVLKQDADFLTDLLCCLLQGCYQRTDIT